MFTHQCWSCNIGTTFTQNGTPSKLENLPYLSSSWDSYATPLKCGWCGNLSIVRSSVPKGSNLGVLVAGVRAGQGISEWRPAPDSAPDLSSVAEHIAGPAREVYLARDTGASRASILMGRAVIEAIAKDYGITQRITLEQKIDKLHEKGIVLASTAEDAHEVRHLGNDMAHGDFRTEVTDDDVDDVIAIMYDLIEQLYISKVRRERLREKREARKGGKG